MRGKAKRKAKDGPASSRRRAEALGRRAEGLCALALMLKGYRILGRRVRNAGGEIDLVARRGRVLAFVEVKARSSGAGAAEAITADKRRRIARAAEAWLAAHPALAALDLRFDALLVGRSPWPRHITDAWRP